MTLSNRHRIIAALIALLVGGCAATPARPAPQKVFLYGVVRDRLDIVQALLNAGFNPNFRDPQGFTPLHYAAVSVDDPRMAAMLLARGADVNARGGPQHDTPLLLAANRGHVAVVHVLLKAGARLNVQNRLGVSALGSAVFSQHLASARALLEAGALINARDRMGATPLWLAAYQGDLPMARLLLSYGADPRLPDARGRTPLMEARARHPHNVALLRALTPP